MSVQIDHGAHPCRGGELDRITAAQMGRLQNLGVALGLKALFCGTLASYLSATIAGIIM